MRVARWKIIYRTIFSERSAPINHLSLCFLSQRCAPFFPSISLFVLLLFGLRLKLSFKGLLEQWWPKDRVVMPRIEPMSAAPRVFPGDCLPSKYFPTSVLRNFKKLRGCWIGFKMTNLTLGENLFTFSELDKSERALIRKHRLLLYFCWTLMRPLNQERSIKHDEVIRGFQIWAAIKWHR